MTRIRALQLPELRALPTGLRTLRLIAVVLPVAVLVIADLLRSEYFPESLDSPTARLALYAGTAAAVLAFTWTVFALVQSLQRSLTEKNRQLEALNRTTAAAAERVELDDLLAAGLDQALIAVGADAGLICLVDTERREHSATCVRGFSAEFAERVQHAKLSDDPIAEQVVDTGRPVIVQRVDDDPRVAEAAAQQGIASFISAPLMAGGEVYGILVLASHTERALSDGDREFIDGLGGHLGIVIRNAVLYEEARHQTRDLSALLAVGGAVASSLDLDEVLKRSLETITSVTTAEAAEFWLLEEGELRLRCRVGPHPDAFLEVTRIALGDGLPGIAAERREVVIVHELPEDGRFLRRSVVAAGYHTFGAIPVQYGDGLQGVLGVAASSVDALTDPGELRLLERIAEQVAPAIENAQLHGQVQDSAVLLERERIAHEMHDGVGQVLGYVNTQTLAVRKLLADGRLSEATTELDNMSRAARQLSSEVRESILGLRMSPSDDGGFLGVIAEYIDGFRDIWSIEIQLDISDGARALKLSPSVEIQLMRIIQEALANVRKHADPRSASVSLEATGAELRVVVRDDGRGFDVANVEGLGIRHFGLQTMRERAQSVGATFEVESRLGDGTCVTIIVPAVALMAGVAG